MPRFCVYRREHVSTFGNCLDVTLFKLHCEFLASYVWSDPSRVCALLRFLNARHPGALIPSHQRC